MTLTAAKLIELLRAATDEQRATIRSLLTQTSPPTCKTVTDSSVAMLPTWYRIPEIAPDDFVACCKPIFTVLTEQHTSKTNTDPFLKSVLCRYATDWDAAERARLKQKALEMKMGDFHEELLGKFPGWETLPVGHDSQMDVRKCDGSVYIECKNKHNTCNADGLRQVHTKLQELKSSRQTRAIFVQINCPDGKVCRSYAPADAEIFNGRDIYTFVSGRDSFYDDLLCVMTYVFREFDTYEALTSALGMI